VIDPIDYNEAELLPWMVLKSVPGVGNLLFKRLIDRFGNPGSIFAADMGEICRVEGVSKDLAVKILNRSSLEWGALRRELELTYRQGCRLLTLNDTEYPSLLREIPDPPPFLYVRGRLTPEAHSFAVVGSRKPTSYGMSVTHQICRELTEHQLVIVSGMARGIDTAAHQGALAAGGPTIGVLGSGLDHIYPSENRYLADRIAETGAVITEFSLATGPEAYNFPLRNRIICGMSLGTLVVEATMQSGSLITARLAAEQGRDVFAVPGSIRSFKSTGPHSLIKQGAKLVENAKDIIDELLPAINFSASTERKKADVPSGLDAEEARVLTMLDPYPIHIDVLQRQADMDPGRISATLLKLELQGLVKQLPGKMFICNRE
jgi:DNA processing protein